VFGELSGRRRDRCIPHHFIPLLLLNSCINLYQLGRDPKEDIKLPSFIGEGGESQDLVEPFIQMSPSLLNILRPIWSPKRLGREINVLKFSGGGEGGKKLIELAVPSMDNGFMGGFVDCHISFDHIRNVR